MGEAQSMALQRPAWESGHGLVRPEEASRVAAGPAGTPGLKWPSRKETRHSLCGASPGCSVIAGLV